MNEEIPLDSIICHDATKHFPLPDECIDVVITSPPYWGLRDYGEQVKSIFGGDPKCEHEWIEEKTGLIHENRNFQEGTQEEVVGQKGTTWIRKYDQISIGFCQICGAWYGQLGLEPHPQMFIDHLVMICREIKRVLKKSGSFYLNLGDTYGTHQSGGKNSAHNFRKSELADKIGHTLKRPRKGFSENFTMEKQLMLIPSRVAIALQDDGWILRNDIIWHKCLSGNTKLLVKKDNTFKSVTIKELHTDWHGYKLPTQNNKGENIWADIRNAIAIGQRDGLSITTKTGRKIICSKNHKLPYRNNRYHKKNVAYRKLKTIKAEELKIGDFLYVNEDMNIQLDKGTDDDYTKGYAVGFYLAEGNYIKREVGNYVDSKYSKYAQKRWGNTEHRIKNVGISLACGIKDIERGNLEEIEKLYLLKRYIYKNNVAVRSRDKKLLTLIDTCVSGETSHTKHLNNIAFNQGRKFMEGILYGFLNGDGCWDEKNNRWRVGICPNIDLKDDIMLLCRFLGYNMRVESIRSNTGSGVLMFSVRTENNRNRSFGCISDEIESIDAIQSDFYDIEITPIYAGRGSNQYSKVTTETMEKKKKTYNHLYFLQNGIWSHNSNPMPSSCKDRLNTTYEHVFHFVKSVPKTTWLLDVPYNEKGKWMWLAALVDGEGCIGISRSKHDDKHDVFSVYLSIGNTNKKLLEECISITGFGKVEETKGTNLKAYIWRVNNRYASTIIAEIYPYLIAKKEQARICFELQKTNRYRGNNKGENRGPKPISEKEWNRKLELYELCKKAKRETLNFLKEPDLRRTRGCARYYYDLDGIRVPHKEGVTRWGGNKMKVPSKQKEQQVLAGALLDEDRPWRNPKGKNPGDVVKHDIAVGRIGNFSYNDPLHTKPYHPDGKNPGDFWNICTRPFPEAHFAVYPEELCIKPIKSSCPGLVCKKCGKPRERITKNNTTYESGSGKSGRKPKGKYKDKEGTGIIGKNLRMRPTSHVTTIGWTKCKCNADFESGIVLDPFCGRGTVGKVAKHLGLHYILFDIKPEYCELARLYIAGQKHKIHKDQIKLDTKELQ